MQNNNSFNAELSDKNSQKGAQNNSQNNSRKGAQNNSQNTKNSK